MNDLQESGSDGNGQNLPGSAESVAEIDHLNTLGELLTSARSSKPAVRILGNVRADAAASAIEAAIHAMSLKPRDAKNRFEVVGDGTVIDHATGLMWTADDVGSGNVTWVDADAAAKAVTLGGFTDWRLPTRHELLSLVDDTRCNPAINIAAFPSCRSTWYWTGTASAPSPGSYAWFVGFRGGASYGNNRGGVARVRAVRSISTSNPHPTQKAA